MTAKKKHVVIVCSICGTSKAHRPSDAAQRSGKYCSRRCSILGRPRQRNMVKLNCAHCKSEFEGWPSENRKYCSKQCYFSDNPSTFSFSDWRAKNIERQLSREKTYRDRNREKINQSNRLWAKRNPEKIKALALTRRALSRDANGLAEATLSIMANANGVCFYCKAKHAKLEFDHIIPVSRGGTSDATNLVACCRSCNASKGAKTLDEWLPTRDYEVRKAVAEAMGYTIKET